jgi:hypothetical protein
VVFYCLDIGNDFQFIDAMKISEYVTAKGSNTDELDKEVERLLELDYEPYGNPYTISASYVCQAMVKSEASTDLPPAVTMRKGNVSGY